jgi:hypothetical protein
MKQHHGPGRNFGETSGARTVDSHAPAGGALVCEGLGKIEAPKLAGLRIPGLLAHGLDSLYVGYFFETMNSRIDWEGLAFRREQLKHGRFGGGEEITIGAETFWLLPYGKKPYSYVLSNRDFEVRLAEHMQPCCYVQFFSEALWRDGAMALHARFLRWASSVGKGDLVVRAYDKVAEIQSQSQKVWMYEVWGQDSGVWRFEFQARGPVLKEHGIKSPEDLFDLQYDLLREITGKHTTLRSPGSDGNRSRWPLHPVWKALRQAIAEHPQEGLVRSFDPASSLRWRRYQQGKYLYGMLKGLGALMSIDLADGRILGLDETFKVLRLLILKREYDPAEWDAELKDRVRRYALGKW